MSPLAWELQDSTETDASDSWESAPTNWMRACAAWCAAAGAVASPLTPPEIEALAAHYRHGPTYPQLVELVMEAVRRAEWLPADADQHFAPLNTPILWQSKTGYGLDWQSSVRTRLACTRGGWVVSIFGEHEQRRRAAEVVLGADASL